MNQHLSLTSVRTLAPEAFRRWVIGGVALSLVGYLTVLLTGILQVGLLRPGSPASPQVLLATIMCAGALLLAVSSHQVVAGWLAIAATFMEVHFTFLSNTTFPAPGMLVLPVLMIAVGLLVGTRGALFATAVTLCATVLAIRMSPGLNSTGFTPLSIYWFALQTIAMFGAWTLLALSLSAFGRVSSEVLAKERDLADTIRFAPDGIVVLDSAHHVLLVNPAAETILGTSREHIVGRSIDQVLADAAEDSAPSERLPCDTGEAPVALQLTPRNGMPVHVEATWRRMEGGRRQLLLHDVSERVRADEARRLMEAQLAHAQRLEAVGQLAGGLSHDFNNILTAVSGSAELLRDEREPSERAALLDEITAASDRGASLTRQLLAFARREVIQSRVLDLSVHVMALQRLLQRVAGERHQLRFDLAPECRVRVDVGQLEQSLVNLVSNARDAMPNGGQCLITVTRVTNAQGSRRVQLHVTDEGAGMTDEVAARAFEPFFTTKARGQGTGLGLASVHGMAVQSAGVASIASAPGRGTRVTIDLPYVDESPAPPPAIVPETTERLGSYMILLAEDDEGTRGIVERILRNAGYQVMVAADGSAAMSLLESAGQPIDLLLTDVMMPGLTGPALAERLRAMKPDVPVLFMTGYAEDALAELGGAPLGQDVISKPFSGRALTTRIADLLRAGVRTDTPAP